MALIQLPAPMTGTIKEILVAVGDSVSEGQELLFVESMKMEIPVESPASGTISGIEVAEGQVIDEGTLLLTIAV